MVVARVPFSAAGVPPEFLTRDLSRQCAQLTALGWAGRIFRVAPWLLAVLGVKNAFELEPYKSDVAWRLEDGTTEITLGDRSLVARGIPFRWKLRLDGGDEIESATLLGIGCDLRPAVPPSPQAVRLDEAAMNSVAAAVNANKRAVVASLTRTIFSEITLVAKAAKAGAEPQAVGEPVRFTPRQELWAREGSAEKWLEERSAYYFAESLLQDVRLEEVPGARFTFYLDETEPLNSEDPMMSPNPEVVCCYFDAAVGGEVS